MKPGKPITPEAWDLFLEELSESGNISQSAKAARISRPTVYERRANDAAFKKQMDKAEELGLDALEDEMIRRGFKGSMRPVYQGGKKVGSIKEFDTVAAIFMLKAKRPEKFKDRVSNEFSGPNGKPIEVSDARSRVAGRLAELAARSRPPEPSGGAE